MLYLSSVEVLVSQSASILPPSPPSKNYQVFLPLVYSSSSFVGILFVIKVLLLPTPPPPCHHRSTDHLHRFGLIYNATANLSALGSTLCYFKLVSTSAFALLHLTRLRYFQILQEQLIISYAFIRKRHLFPTTPAPAEE